MNPRSLVKWLVPVVLDAVQDYLKKNPELLDQFGEIITAKLVAALPRVIDNLTNITPWKIDDVVLDSLAKRIVNLLPSFLPDFLKFRRP
ncbi:TPA_asm: hypothetical protein PROPHIMCPROF_74 [Mycobacterium phage McProf]|uniref:hypothetical protein n=1 Tax=Mycobacteroides chelonae TaxID=1774 RepID=UPI00061A0597|nr:hypothetical protein [Mycobacteroides chelonae]VEG15744.1 Uncharacterised protein [Mycolicibacterium phlei]DAZ90062.1 TPA_asm: hypothetical protein PROPHIMCPROF_74 [Mycobacterium phage McProf]ANA97691.1 hypothetical protein BB28_07990 [Mycobacteroides chelonae CCUG 47445]OLT75196.1 hypothetical protein BKG56_15620 [Mycobacteroides chelonae]ORV12847.1 hypothetical protein AWB96_15865 [Mycobacteroides chelonae]